MAGQLPAHQNTFGSVSFPWMLLRKSYLPAMGDVNEELSETLRGSLKSLRHRLMWRTYWHLLLLLSIVGPYYRYPFSLPCPTALIWTQSIASIIWYFIVLILQILIYMDLFWGWYEDPSDAALPHPSLCIRRLQ